MGLLYPDSDTQLGISARHHVDLITLNADVDLQTSYWH